jgi:hypothetical protein
MRRTRLYQTWVNMLGRCYYPSVKCYPRYGGRGIRVCDDWLKFESFGNWALTHGYQDDLTIERIDPDGHYEPGNCEFITRAENNRRRRAPKKAVINEKGEQFESIVAAARAYNRHQSRISKAVRDVNKTCAGLKWRYVA